MPDALTILLLVGVGLSVGSFLNVCIYRLPRGQSLVLPRSRCPACGRALRWRENVPVVGYLWLRGRCASCTAPISPMYPIVEATTAGLFLLHDWQFGLALVLVPRLLFACAMLVLFAIDLQHRILPNVITLPGILAGFVFSFFFSPGWIDSLIGIALGGGILLVIAEAYYRVRGEEGMGMGDVKMLAMIGAFLGWQPVLVTMVLASLLGSVVGLALMASRRGGMKSALPFGTFLAIGAVVSSLVGPSLLEWYLSFY